MPPREPVIEDELKAVIRRAEIPITKRETERLVKALSSYVDQVAEESYKAGFDQAKEPHNA